MSWLDRVRNSLPFAAKRETADTLWHKCPSCSQMVFIKEYRENLSVCPKCNHHGRIGPQDRFTQLFDDGSWTQLPTPQVADDPLTCVARGGGRALELVDMHGNEFFAPE